MCPEAKPNHSGRGSRASSLKLSVPRALRPVGPQHCHRTGAKEAPLGTSTVLTLVTRWHRYTGCSQHQRWDSPGQELEEHAHNASTLVLKLGLSASRAKFGFTSHLCCHHNRLLKLFCSFWSLTIPRISAPCAHTTLKPQCSPTYPSPPLHVPILTFRMSPDSPVPKSLPCLCHLPQAHSTPDSTQRLNHACME